VTTLDLGMARLRSAANRMSTGWTRFGRLAKAMMPKGLYARSLLIIIAPMVILQSVVAFVFMERHWTLVTQNLSAAVVRDIAALIELSKTQAQDPEQALVKKIALERLGLVVDFLPVADMPPPGPKPDYIVVVGVLVGEDQVVAAPGEDFVFLAVADALEDLVVVAGAEAGYCPALDDLVGGQRRGA